MVLVTRAYYDNVWKRVIDTREESIIRWSLGRLLAERTSIVNAYRLSMVRNADQILVIEAGGIAECGTHTSLLAAGGLYRRPFRAPAPAVTGT
jgi:ABC-type transport system involved in Fe-S cluster assembly fused permease/ATPase subunit